MSNEISGSVIHCKDARQMWLDLQDRFYHVNIVQLFHIENEIHDCVQSNMTVSSYFTKLKSLWDERDALCSIPACRCEMKKEIASYVETQKTMKFLMGLNDSYATVRSNTILLEPLPTINKAYALVLRHEKQAGVSSGKNIIQPEKAVFAVKGVGRETKSDDDGQRCGKCYKINHNTKNFRAHLKCTFCGEKGHTFDFCRKRKTAAENESSCSFSSKGNHVTSHDKNEVMPSFPFSQEDCRKILQMLNKNKSSFANQVGNSSHVKELSGKAFSFTYNGKKDVWILDSGATDHIVCSPDLLTHSRPVANHTVELPNGSFAKVTHIGQIIFSPNLILDNVLCIPPFRLNLISISKLAYDSFYITIVLNHYRTYAQGR
ncbi:hypothetical protein ACFX11_009942 [Malus domestica]